MSCLVSFPPPNVHSEPIHLLMSKFFYSMTMQIYKSPPCLVNPGPDVSNPALVIPLLVMLPPLNLIMPVRNQCSIGFWRGRRMVALEIVVSLTMSLSLLICHFIM